MKTPWICFLNTEAVGLETMLYSINFKMKMTSILYLTICMLYTVSVVVKRAQLKIKSGTRVEQARALYFPRRKCGYLRVCYQWIYDHKPLTATLESRATDHFRFRGGLARKASQGLLAVFHIRFKVIFPREAANDLPSAMHLRLHVTFPLDADFDLLAYCLPQRSLTGWNL